LSDLKWWQRGIVYQIYPRSFQDSDGDGIGDLVGLLSRLDYLAWLGIDAVWISPIYPSPMADFGYDITDHCALDPVFGTLEQFNRLVDEVHRRDLRVLLDFVPNHTSDRHPWFLESRSSRDSPKRDWYIWHDPAPDAGPPTNWLSEFGGSAWQWDEDTGQYYYHAYLKEQPDLNWRNAQVRAAMLDVLRFWLDHGVDGFRIDAIHHLIKDAFLRNNPPNPDWRPGMAPARRLLRVHTADRPQVQDAIREMRQVAEEYGGDKLLLGEAYLPVDRMMSYYGSGLTGLHLPLNFHLIFTPWKAEAIASLIEAYEAALPPGAWPNWVIGSHDVSRVVSRIGPDQARLAAMLLLTLRGTPTVYQGEEIGMADVPIPPSKVQDPREKNTPGLGLGRDPARTPMHWDASANAGFTSGWPWLPLAADCKTVNVASEREDPGSMLRLYTALIALRRAEPALSAGAYVPVSAREDVLVYERRHDGSRIVVALNMAEAPRKLDQVDEGKHMLLSTHRVRTPGSFRDDPTLQPAEGVILTARPARQIDNRTILPPDSPGFSPAG